MSKAYNLDIKSYSLKDLFSLFEINDYMNITIDDMKRAKKRVLMTHPDKSQLPAEYFLFYKKAFDIIVKFYDNQNKQNTEITAESTQYKVDKTNNEKQVKNAINELSKEDFHRKFNQLFEENMANRPDSSKNEWFSKEEAVYDIKETVTTKNMGVVFDKIKETQNAMIKYGGVKNLSTNNGSRLYEDGDEDGDESDNYLSSDPFSKLKYDDLRKVHKDQTVFMVSERDINKVQQYSSVDHYARERGGQNIKPIDKVEAEQILNTQNKQYQEYIRHKEYAAELKLQKNMEKNKSVLANFLRLGN